MNPHLIPYIHSLKRIKELNVKTKNLKLKEIKTGVYLSDPKVGKNFLNRHKE